MARWVLPVLVGPRMARTGASERGAIIFECGSARGEGKVPTAEIRLVLTSIGETGCRVDVTKPRAPAAAVAFACLAASRLDRRRRARAPVQHGRLGVAPAAERAAGQRAAAMAGAGRRAFVE